MQESKTYEQLKLEIEKLQVELEEANDVIEAIRTGSIDALIVKEKDIHQLYTLKTADQTYRVFIEKMNEGAVTLNKDGWILYCNSRFASIVDVPLSNVIGVPFIDFVPKEFKRTYNSLIDKGWQSDSKGEIQVLRKDGSLIPLLLSLTTLELDEGTALSIILSDLTEQKKIQARLESQNEELEIAHRDAGKLNDELEDIVNQRTAELLISNEHLELAISAADLGTWSLNPLTNKFIANERVKKWFGILPDEEIDLERATNVVIEKDRQRVMEAIQTALQFSSGGIYDVEYTIINPEDGKERVLRARGKAFFDKDGQAERFSGTIQDITEDVLIAAEQVAARIKMEELEERARLAVDAADMGTFDLNLATNKLITSPRFDAIFDVMPGYTQEEYLNVLNKEDLDIRNAAHQASFETGRLFYIARVVWKDKTQHWIRVKGKMYYDNEGKPERLLGTIMDITDQKFAEEALLSTNQRLEIALEAGRLGSYELNIETGEIISTEQYKKNYGLTENAVFNYNDLVNLIVPAFREKFNASFRQAINNGSIYSEEYQVKWADGSQHWIKASGKCMYNNAGKPVKIIGVAFDITEHKELQQQKDDFIGIASHELKTPVTSIKAYTQLLEKILIQKGDINEAAMVAKMGRQVNRLTNLISDLLDVTKMNSGRLEFNQRMFDFNILVNDVAEELQRTTEKHEFIINLDKNNMVYADKERIGQVMTNLISNAIKYSPDSDRILINTLVENNKVIFCVKDFGIGIPEEKKQKVFEQFYRVSGDMQHTFPGLGLGLYISSEIIQREGGRIWVESNQGRGSTFCFSLPVKKQFD